ncbi:MAG: cyanophycinase [Gemmatimonadaceae bacterium]|nr:cyanophycinase [Gemmatimonadaceae bacterium]
MRWRNAREVCRAVLVLLLLSSVASTPLAAQSRGTLYIVGGGPQPDALVREFVELAGGPGKARIIVFAMASESGRTSGEEKAQDFRALGAQARNLWIGRDEAMRDSIAALLDSATGIWFGGGDQVLLTRALLGTRTEQAIHARYAAGAVIGGTSAGAAVMSRVMITGDERRPGGSRPDTTLAWGTIERDNVVVAEGFGLLPDVIVDQHFLRRKRYGRLLALVLERAPHVGAGIDESTALVVGPDGRWRVRGASSVVIFDARRAERPANGRLVQGARVQTYVLSDGGTFDPATGRVTFGTAP